MDDRILVPNAWVVGPVDDGPVAAPVEGDTIGMGGANDD